MSIPPPCTTTANARCHNDNGSFADIWEAYARVIEQEQLTQNESKAQTNHVERFNCTLRQRLGRLVRETFSFSKSDLMHYATLAIFIHRYNISKITH